MANEKIKLTLSEHSEENYVATVTRIKEIYPIEGSDNLVRTVLEGCDMVIPNTMKIGDIVIHCMIGSTLNSDFLGANNLFDVDNFALNKNYSEVKKLIDNDNKEAAKRLIGFFGAQGRVKAINLRSTPSQGFICDFDAIRAWKPNLIIENEENLVGITFDTVNDELFIKKYIIEEDRKKGNGGEYFKKVGKFDRMIPNQFNFHYDTTILNKCIYRIEPNSHIHVSVKKHGTSIVMSKVLTKVKLTMFQKLKKWFGCKVNDIAYGSIYSSASVIRNKYGYNNQVDTFSGVDIYGAANKIIYPLLNDGMTVYGELYGYVPNATKCIQKQYDYGCKQGKYLILPYRITTTTPNGEVFEWEVGEVIDWTNKVIKEHPELKDNIAPLETLYCGLAKDLYPTLPIDENWNGHFLELLKVEKRFFMEENDPQCVNKVPFEGVVIKFTHSRKSEAFKLKCQKFYMKEQKAVDKGEVDMETAEKNKEC